MVEGLYMNIQRDLQPHLDLDVAEIKKQLAVLLMHDVKVYENSQKDDGR